MKTARWTMIVIGIALLTWALALPLVGARPPGAPPAGAPAPASAPTTAGVLKLKHMTVDLAKKQIVIDAEVSRNYKPGDPLEFFLCRADTKDYESVITTPAMPSDVHAALLAMGLSPGKFARMSRPDTQPARVLPPEGARLAITLRWKDANDVQQEAPAGAWLATTGRKESATPKEWLFIGSDVLPGGGYLADQEGVIISVVNVAWAVIDVPVESIKQYAALEFTRNEKAVPPNGTPVQVVIQVLPGGENAPAARMLIEIDRFGRCWVEGKPLGAEDLTPWAEKYLRKHAEGMAVLRADADARIGDLERARDQLRFGGVAEIEEQRLAGTEEPLPRTAEQSASDMKRWKEKFARWDRLLMDPFQEAQDRLVEIEQELKLLEARGAMLAQYAASLKAALAASRAATQAAPKD